jgi:hypothetical protein
VVSNETAHLYRYFDETVQSEYLVGGAGCFLRWAAWLPSVERRANILSGDARMVYLK